jgi:peptidoglycan/xylan/chitin deacetylase (PgdA/CDA1 family)
MAMPWLVAVGLLVVLLTSPAPAAADTGGWAVPNGWYFEKHGGYAVRDADDQPFWTTFQALGGTASLGYPLSRRFTWEGRTVQVFERAALAYDPKTKTVMPLALLDLLSAKGHDAALAAQFGVPPATSAREAQTPTAAVWPETCVPCRRSVRLPGGDSLPRSAFVAERLAWLATVPALVHFYETTPWAPAALGVPTASPQRHGAEIVARFQYGAIRTTAQSTSDAATVLEVGAMARALGLFPPGDHWTPEQLSRPLLEAVSRPAAPAAAAAGRGAAAAPATAPSRPIPAPASPSLRGAISRGSAASDTVALTFDMGLTTSGALPSVLETLDRASIRATFFITGAWAEAQPDMLRRLIAAGHEIANHSYSHPDLTKLDIGRARWEIEHTEELARSIAGQTTKPYFRPPFGAYNASVLALVEELGYRLVMWTVDSGDWRPESTAATIAQRAGARTAPGDIVVMHGYVPKTAQALPSILAQLAERGLRGGTLREALGSR